MFILKVLNCLIHTGCIQNSKEIVIIESDKWKNKAMQPSLKRKKNNKPKQKTFFQILDLNLTPYWTTKKPALETQKYFLTVLTRWTLLVKFPITLSHKQSDYYFHVQGRRSCKVKLSNRSLDLITGDFGLSLNQNYSWGVNFRATAGGGESIFWVCVCGHCHGYSTVVSGAAPSDRNEIWVKLHQPCQALWKPG